MFNACEGGYKTLDVIAGKNNASTTTCADVTGPTIQLYLQKHPYIKNRFVNVLILKNHLSDDYIERTYIPSFEKLAFQSSKAKKSNSFIRISSKERSHPNEPIPVITYGNSIRSRKQYRAAAITCIEKNTCDFATLVFRAADKAVLNAIHQLETFLNECEGRTESEIQQSSQKKGPTNKSSDCNQMLPFAFPIGNDYPIDSPDSVVIQATTNIPYGNHSDSTTPCNHNNNKQATSSDQMRIYTNAIAPLAPIDDPLLTIRHGIPEANGENAMCKIVGYFCSKKLAFVPWTLSNGDGIPVGGKSHAHVQWHGSQGMIHHYLRPLSEQVRIVESCRQLHPNQISHEQQKQEVIRDIKVFDADTQKITGVFALLTGEKRFVSPINSDIPSKKKKKRSKRTRDTCTSVSLESHPTKKKQCAKLVVGRHQNGKVEEYERVPRDQVVGIDSKITLEDIARCSTVAKAFYNRKCTVLLNRGTQHKEKDATVIIGPLVKPNKNVKDSHYLVRPGEKFEPTEIDSGHGIKSSSMNQGVINTKKADVVHIRRFSKNCPDVIENVVRTYEGKQMLPMTLRGQGGADTKAGSKPIPCHHPNAVKEGATYFVSSYQSVTNKYHQAFDRSVQIHQSVIVYARGVYLGAFTVDSSLKRSIDKDEEVDKVIENTNRHIKVIHQLDSDRFPEKELTEQMIREIRAIRSVCQYIRLVPLHNKFNSHWNKNDDVDWNVIKLSLDDFHKPTYLFESIDGLPPTIYTNWMSLLDNGLPFLKNEVKTRLGLEEESMNDNLCPEVDISTRSKFDLDIYENGLVHGSMFSSAKTFGPCLTDRGSKIIPPSFIFDDMIANGIFKSREDAYKQTGLASLASRPNHPITVVWDLVAIIAMASTNSFDETLRETDGCGRQKYRLGPHYIINNKTNEEAWDIIFKCLLSCMVNPCVMVQISHKREGKLAPSPNDLDDFVSTAKMFQWEQRFLHDLFRPCFAGGDVFFEFLTNLKRSGKQIFVDAVKFNIDGLGKGDRCSIITTLTNGLRHCSDNVEIAFTEFHMQVIARTIEVCLHTPFGNVTSVATGPGGRSGSMCFVQLFKHCTNQQHLTATKAVALIPQWIVTTYNNKVRSILKEDETSQKKAMKDQTLKVLEVKGLQWSTEDDCLIHRIGIGKRFDPSDVEHSNCCFYGQIQYTQPNRNDGISNVVHLDGDKHGPIKHNYKDVLAKDLPFMATHKHYFDTVMMPAYASLLKDESYQHKNLHDKFQITIDKKMSSTHCHFAKPTSTTTPTIRTKSPIAHQSARNESNTNNTFIDRIQQNILSIFKSKAANNNFGKSSQPRKKLPPIAMPTPAMETNPNKKINIINGSKVQQINGLLTGVILHRTTVPLNEKQITGDSYNTKNKNTRNKEPQPKVITDTVNELMELGINVDIDNDPPSKTKYHAWHNHTQTTEEQDTNLYTDSNTIIITMITGHSRVFVENKSSNNKKSEHSNELGHEWSLPDELAPFHTEFKVSTYINNRDGRTVLLEKVTSGKLLLFSLCPGDIVVIPSSHLHTVWTYPQSTGLSLYLKQ